MRLLASLAIALMFSPIGVQAQDDQTLADIRQELTILYVSVQRLKRELSTTGLPSPDGTVNSVLDRVNAMEVELQRLTSMTEQLEFRINRIVEDGTNRIGDLEFRLVELEGGDISTLGETTTLGGDPAVEVPGVVPPTAPDTQLAIGEEQDFQNAQAALENGDFEQAVEKFTLFNQTYPGGPLAAGADLGRGKALEGMGNTREAARAYLSSFSLDPAGQVAPDALFLLGRSLGDLGQTTEACVTLGQVGTRFPEAPAAQEARAHMASIGCS